MKKIIYNFLLLLFVMSLPSCLKSGLEDLPEYEDADITSVSAVRYRYYSDQKSPASGEFIVKEAGLKYDYDIDAVKGEVKIEAEAPDNFPSAQLGNLSKSDLVVVVGLSTAARLSPVGGSPRLGVPGDWSKANTYVVTSASGIQKTWKIEVVSLVK